MAIQIYNSLTRKKEEFIPLKDNTVNMYTCGVTVYDKCHLGHARSLYIFNVIRNYLEYRKFKVNFVRNITDIDDKIIKRAQELNKTSDEVAKENIALYHEDLKRLGIQRPDDKEPRATENIGQMIKVIEGLIAKDIAYAVNGDVYFSVRKFAEYGKLSGQSIEQMIEAVRIEKDLQKKDPLDFALWKKSKEEEPFWESPWGKGRPGWHIECSVMSLNHLKCETLDIHGGGRDLIFPHHENEIAQAESLTGKPFAKYWLHHGLLTINGQKMSKSLGNFVTIEDALKKYELNDLKMFFLSSHYASPIDFTEEKMAEAKKAVDRFDVLFWKASDIITKEPTYQPIVIDFVAKHRDNFLAAMDDDFNTPKALGHLFELLNDTNKFLDQKKSDRKYIDTIYHAVDTIENLTTNIFGLFKDEATRELSKEEERLIKDRQEARTNKDFKKSDTLRELLKQKGIAVEDTQHGQTWRWI